MAEASEDLADAFIFNTELNEILLNKKQLLLIKDNKEKYYHVNNTVA